MHGIGAGTPRRRTSPADSKAKAGHVGAPSTVTGAEAGCRGPGSARGAAVSRGAGAATADLWARRLHPGARPRPSRWDRDDAPRGHLATPGRARCCCTERSNPPSSHRRKLCAPRGSAPPAPAPRVLGRRIRCLISASPGTRPPARQFRPFDCRATLNRSVCALKGTVAPSDIPAPRATLGGRVWTASA